MRTILLTILMSQMLASSASLISDAINNPMIKQAEQSEFNRQARNNPMIKQAEQSEFNRQARNSWLLRNAEAEVRKGQEQAARNARY